MSGGFLIATVRKRGITVLESACPNVNAWLAGILEVDETCVWCPGV